MNADHDDKDITLPLLQCIEESSDITQRSLAKKIGVALGVTNTYLKHCIHKGLIKIEQIPANRYLYYLTPQGFAEKSRLTAKYLSKSFQFYRKASDSCQRVCGYCKQHDWQRVVLCGVSDLAELAILVFEHAGIDVVGIYDADSEQGAFHGHVVWKQFDELPAQGVFVITALHATPTLKQQLLTLTSEDKIIIPDLLQG